MNLTGPDRYAVIGDPVAHSRSPEIHAAFAQQTGKAVSYDRLHAPRGTFADAVGRFAASGGRGLNVTLPFKEEAFALAAERSARAQIAGACNVLARNHGGWYGDNTDGAGLVRDLEHNLGWRLAGRSILVLGAGGAARGIVAPLLGANPRRIAIVNRTHDKAVRLAAVFASTGPVDAVPSDAVADRDFDVVINATSAAHAKPGTAAHEWPLLRARGELYAYDLSYGPAARAFLDWASARGASAVSDGLGMLVEQAAESFLVWRGVRPDTSAVLDALRAGA